MQRPAMPHPWASLEAGDPDLAEAVAGRFAANLHHVLGTIAEDGRPRLSGIEVPVHGGHLWLGMMPASVKCTDLRRDPRFAVHSAPLEEDLAEGDAKVDAVAREVAEGTPGWAAFLDHSGMDLEHAPGGGMALFTADLVRVTLTRVADDALHVTTWTPTAGTTRRRIG